MQKMQRLCLAAALAALCCAATFIHIPYPLGYLNLGDCIVLLCGVLLPPLWAMAAAGIGSALADLFLGYALYAPATLLIKALMALVVALFCRRQIRPVRSLMGGILSEGWMVLGYFLYEMLLYGAAPAAQSALSVNLPQGAVNLAAAAALFLLLQKSKLLHKMRRGIHDEERTV